MACAARLLSHRLEPGSHDGRTWWGLTCSHRGGLSTPDLQEWRCRTGKAHRCRSPLLGVTHLSEVPRDLAEAGAARVTCRSGIQESP